ncbi:hypothetical protein JCM6882_007754 [Rhodosporidiobolus microsporus]
MSTPSGATNGSAHSSITGTDYLSSLASFIRTHESALANYYAPRQRTKAAPPPSWATVLTLGIVPTAEDSSATTPPPPPLPRRDPLVLKFDPHHLYYLLLKFDELAIAGVGDLDVKVDGGTSRPMSVDYSSLVPPGEDGNGGPGSILGGMFGLGSANGGRRGGADDAMSVRSGMSSFSFGSGWWGLGGAKAPPADEASDVRYIYSSCTKLPALKLSPFRLSAAPTPGAKDSTPALVRAVEGFEDCPPPSTCVPLLAFKNLSSLVLEDLDPRGFYGWDVLSVQLRSLEVSRGGIEDIGELICDAPVEDAARRAATERRDRAVGSERRKRAEGSAGSLAASIADAPAADAEYPASTPPSPATASYPSPSKLAWSSLRHLSLADNDLTFIPSPPLTFLPTLTSLDLSSNLLISIPPGLAHLTSLRSLNLSNNMIDSLLGIAKALGAIEVLNLSNNRLENLSGLDRLAALERLDVRENHLNEALEVSRVARLPHLREVWVKANPFSRRKEEGGEEHWRVKCFGYFAEEEACGHRDLSAGEIRIDGVGMSGSERRAVEAEQSRKGTPLGRRRASVGAVERVAESRNGEAKVVGRRVVTAPHRAHHRDGGHQHRAASPPPPLPTASSSAAHADAAPARPASPPVSTKSPAKAKRRRPRRVVDLDAAPGSAVAHPAAPPSSSGRYSDSEPTSSGAETSSHARAARVDRPSTVAEEPSSTATTTTDDGGLSSSPRLPSFTLRHPRNTSSPQTSRITGVSSLGASSSPHSSPSKRRERVSASTYEPATTSAATFDAAGMGGAVESSADAYRRRIEKLREEVGDHYLSVLGEREAMEELEKGKGKDAPAAEEREVVKPVPVRPDGGDSVAAGDETKEEGSAPAEEVRAEDQEVEAAAVAPALKEGVKVVKKKKKGKGKKK